MKYGDLTHKETLQFCEFDLVSVYQTQQKELFLITWTDVSGPIGGQYDHYVAASVTQDQIDAYKARQLSIRQIQLKAQTLYRIKDGVTMVGDHAADSQYSCDELPYAELFDFERAPRTSFYEPMFASEPKSVTKPSGVCVLGDCTRPSRLDGILCQYHTHENLGTGPFKPKRK